MELAETQKLIEVIKLLDQMNVTWMKIRIGSYQYWILSKEKPKQTRVAGAPVNSKRRDQNDIRRPAHKLSGQAVWSSTTWLHGQQVLPEEITRAHTSAPGIHEQVKKC